jgi:hypothetical protein
LKPELELLRQLLGRQPVLVMPAPSYGDNDTSRIFLRLAVLSGLAEYSCLLC